jgi:hypothetical protein
MKRGGLRTGAVLPAGYGLSGNMHLTMLAVSMANPVVYRLERPVVLQRL